MCGRFTLTTPYSTILSHFDIPDQGPQAVFNPRYNIAPSQYIAVVMKLPDQPERHLAMMHWGLIPFWTKDKKGATIRKLFDIVWVTGVMKTEKLSTDLADTGYTISATKVEPY